MNQSRHTLLPLRLHIQPSRTDTRPLVLFHGKGCPDGFAAALAAWLFYDGKAEFRGLDHGDISTVADLGDIAGRSVYILDFSLPAELLTAIDECAERLVMLDHHQSAADKLAGFTCRCGVVHFDMCKSGARLAWEFFFPEREVPALVAMVEDRDIWAWQIEGSAAFLSALDMEEQDFARWAALAELQGDALATFMVRGQAMDDKFKKLAAEMAEIGRAHV